MTETRTASFGPYTLDLRSGEFRKFGVRVKMGEQPFQILVALLERPGEMVEREELRAKLWPRDTFVDFDHGLNSAVQRLRDCLSDTAEDPEWVETVPRRGYRFVGKVEWRNGAGVPAAGRVGASDGAALDGASARSRQEVADKARAKGRGWPAGVTVALVAAGLAITVWYVVKTRATGIGTSETPFQTYTISQVTNNGKAIAAAISPDGKYLLSVQEDGGDQSVWLHHVETNSDVQVIPASRAAYQSLVFSPDGNYFYVRKATDESRSSYNLLRAPILGGAPQPVSRDLDTAAAFSPDGSRMVFARANNPDAGKYLVITAKADGTDEKIYSSGDITTWPQIVAWSPGGKKFATLPYVGMQGSLSPVVILDVSTKNAEVLGPFRRNYLSDLAWMPGDEGLLVLYQNPPNLLTRAQIGYLDSRTTAKKNEGGRVDVSPGGGAEEAADGALRSITRDTNGYRTLTVSSDGKMLATVKQTARQTLYVMPASGFSGKTPDAAAAQDPNSSLFSWTASGDVYFGGGGELLQMSRDGKSRTTLLRVADTVMLAVSECAGGKYLLVDWMGHGEAGKMNIWRVNTDGSGAKQLSFGGMDAAPLCSPNGKMAYYADQVTLQVMRVPVEDSGGAGKAEMVPGTAIPKEIYTAGQLDISRDGKFLAFSVGGPAEPHAGGRIAVVPIGGATPGKGVKLLYPDSRIGPDLLNFTPDGKAVVYVIRENGVENLWGQPVDGGSGKQITNFTADGIREFEFSPDGKMLGVLQEHVESDVVLLQDTTGK